MPPQASLSDARAAANLRATSGYIHPQKLHVPVLPGYTTLGNVDMGNSRQECWPSPPCCGAMQPCSTSKEL